MSIINEELKKLKNDEKIKNDEDDELESISTKKKLQDSLNILGK
jgi:hypothetical protein